MKKLGFGFMRLPVLDSENPTSIDYETLDPMVDEFMQKGFTYFDTAWMYHSGASEEAIREAVVKRYPRDSFTVATKMPIGFMQNAGQHAEIFQQQLDRTGAEYFDYYLLHSLDADHYVKAQAFGTFGFLAEKKRQGVIRRLGFSYHDEAELLDKILTEHPEMEFVQLQINYLDWENPSIQSRRNYEVARKHGKPVIVMEPLKGGALANVPAEAEALFKAGAPEMSTASWGIRYAASLPGVEVVLSGMGTPRQLADNTGFMRDFVPLSDEEAATVTKARGIINAAISIPCTACQYCVDTCPRNIPIPRYFSLYNDDMFANGGKQPAWSLQGMYYGNLVKTYGKASDCVGCRVCEGHCPQKLPVASHLAEVAARYETA